VTGRERAVSRGRYCAAVPVVGSDRDVVVDRLRLDLDRLRAEYARALPFPHLVIDDVLPAELYEAALDEFPAADDPSWSGYLHLNERKFANARVETWGEALREIAEALWSDAFVAMLGALTGFDGLIADRAMDGGGLHQTLRRGFLNVHTDFTTNHRVRSWQRRVNILVYFNREWSPEWGGALELWDPAVTSCVRSIVPVGNRMVIFTTSDDTYHGHPEPLLCPEGEARRSLALYYFTSEHRPPRRATNYQARPGDGNRLGIWADRQALRLYDVAKSKFGITDGAVRGVLHRIHRTAQRVHRLRRAGHRAEEDRPTA
jgi:hypothetical protein